MFIRKYQKTDSLELFKLFSDTIHSINSKDYPKDKLDVWIDKDRDLSLWEKALSNNYTLVIEENKNIVGFGSKSEKGYLDMLFVHKDFQGKGIASLLCDKLENIFSISKITVHSSITAKPFFKKRGYKVIKKQIVERKGKLLINYVMEKYFY